MLSVREQLDGVPYVLHDHPFELTERFTPCVELVPLSKNPPQLPVLDGPPLQAA